MVTGQVALAGVSRAVEYQPLPVKTALRPSNGEGLAWHWTLNPYRGCEMGCTFCRVRLDQRELSSWLDFERRIGVKTQLVEAFRSDLRSEAFQKRPILLGSETEPWQPAEETFRVTRGLLAAMAEEEGLDVRIHTRSSLVARDTDVLLKLARKNRVTLTFSLASVDDRINRLMEPKAPSALRRLAAMEALARAGLETGLLVSPVMAGIDEKELGLEALLTRAANAGARFAGLGFLQLGPGERETFLSHATARYPALSARFRRVIGRRTHSDEDQRALTEHFRGLCGRLGLEALEQRMNGAPSERTAEPTQMALFAGEAGEAAGA